jgi:hypothetical protein
MLKTLQDILVMDEDYENKSYLSKVFIDNKVISINKVDILKSNLLYGERL